MSVPLDRLYNFLDSVSDHNLVIYRWYPHGSKKLSDLDYLKSYTSFDLIQLPQVIFHDQEPVNFEYYTCKLVFDQIVNHASKGYKFPDNKCPPQLEEHYKNISKQNLYGYLHGFNVYDKALLVHSEKNSKQVSLYQSVNLIPVYYWSHAIIARDWHRYAEIDPALTIKKNINFDFLVYNRSWTGTREYRLKFAEMIVQSNLHKNCHMNFSKIDDGNDYCEHVFANSSLVTNIYNLENYFRSSDVCSNGSADYNSSDYQQCGIEVVLETLFDDSRLHLTEKTLRPIACGMPFILAGTPGSLQYLRDYGFKTFGDFFDEGYDQIQDPYLRLCKIIDVMKNIANLPTCKKHKLYQDMKSICDHNRTRFFSKEFFQLIVNEYKENLNNGIQQLKTTTSRIEAELQAEKTFPNFMSDSCQKWIINWLQQTQPITS